MVKYWKHVSTACMVVLAAAVVPARRSTRRQGAGTAKDVLPAAVAAGADYTVSDPVVADGYMYHFKVKSPYAVFDVTGTGALRKLEREIWAIGQLKQVTKSEAFLKSLKDQAGKPLVFAKDVITKPGETLSGIPKGVGRLFSNAATAITNTRDPSQESAAKELLLVGSFKRDYAARFEVDPVLEQPGAAGRAGQDRQGGGVRLLDGLGGDDPDLGPRQHGDHRARACPSPSTISSRPSRPRASASSTRRSWGRWGSRPISPSTTSTTRSITPRQDLLLVDSLHRLGGGHGGDAYLTAAMAAADEVEANFFVNMAQILRGFHEKQGPITGITMVGPLTVAQTKAGAALIPFALDHGVWTENADKLSQQLKASYRAPGFNGNFEFWVTGTLSPKAKQELQARGFTVVEQVGGRIESSTEDPPPARVPSMPSARSRPGGPRLAAPGMGGNRDRGGFRPAAAGAPALRRVPALTTRAAWKSRRGLSARRSIVEAHGGTIRAERDADRGLGVQDRASGQRGTSSPTARRLRHPRRASSRHGLLARAPFGRPPDSPPISRRRADRRDPAGARAPSRWVLGPIAARSLAC